MSRTTSKRRFEAAFPVFMSSNIYLELNTRTVFRSAASARQTARSTATAQVRARPAQVGEGRGEEESEAHPPRSWQADLARGRSVRAAYPSLPSQRRRHEPTALTTHPPGAVYTLKPTISRQEVGCMEVFPHKVPLA